MKTKKIKISWIDTDTGNKVIKKVTPEQLRLLTPIINLKIE